MKPLLYSVVALSLLLVSHATSDVKDVIEEVEKSEEQPAQARPERCTTCAGSLKLNIKSPKEALAAIQALPGAEVHTQQSFEGCSTEKGCAGLKVKDGRIIERFGNIDAFKAAAASDTAKEFTFHAAGALGNVFEGGLPGAGPFWWMNKDSPFKAGAAGGSFEKFSQSSSSSFNTGAGAGTTGAGAGFGANAALDLTANPFLNGDFSKLAAAGATGAGIDASVKPGSSYQSSSFESSSFTSKGDVDLSKNPFLNGAVSFGAGQGAGQAATGVGSQFNANSQSSFAAGGKFGTGYTGSSPSPFATGSNVNLIQNSQKTNEFDFEQQQTQQNIDEAFQSTGNVQAHGGDLQQTCAGQGYVCVPKAQCNNGVVNTNGAGVLQAKTKKQYCNVRTEICCRIEVSAAGAGSLQGSLGVGSGTFQSTAQGSSLFGQTGQSAFNAQGQTNAFGASSQTNGFGVNGQSLGTAQTNLGASVNRQSGFANSAVDRQSTFNSQGVGSVGIGAVGTNSFGSTGSLNRGSTTSFDASRGSVSTNKFGATFGSTVGSTLAPSTQTKYGTSQSNFIETDSFSAGSETAGVFRPGSVGSGLKPGIPYLPPVDNTNSGSNIFPSTAFPTPTFVTTPRPFTTPKPTYLPPITSTSAPAYLPPIGEQTINRETRLPPGPNYIDGQLILDENRQPRPKPPTPGPAPSDIPAGCAAALKCTPIEFCTAEGVISNTSVVLTRDQDAYRVPLTDCKDIATGRIGKCCRDPYYTDPWPVNQLGQWVPGVFGGNDGKYVPDSKVSPNNVRPAVTVRPFVTGSVTLDAFRDTPATPAPTRPFGPSRVTPGYPSTTLTQGVKQTVVGQGQYSQRGQGQYSVGGQGQYSVAGQGLGGVQANQLASGSNTAYSQTAKEQGILVGQGQGSLVSKGQGTLVSQGQGSLVSQGQGTIVSQGVGQGTKFGVGQYEANAQASIQKGGLGVVGQRGQGQIVTSGQGSGISQGFGTGIQQGVGQVSTSGQGFGVSQGFGTGIRQGQGQISTSGQGVGVSQGFGTGTITGVGVSQGFGTGVRQGQGQITTSGQGTGISQGFGTGTVSGQGLAVSQGFGTGIRQGQGQVSTSGQGVGVSQGFGTGTVSGQGLAVSQGFGTGVRQGQGQITTSGQGVGVSQGFGTGIRQGQGQLTTSGQGVAVSQGFGTGTTSGQGVGVSQGFGTGIRQGQGQIVSQGTGQLVSQGQGSFGTRGQGQIVSQGGGALVSQGGGALVSQGGGSYTQGGGGSYTQGGGGQYTQGGGGALVSQGAGFGVSKGQGFGVTTGQGQAVFQGQGSLISQGFGAGIRQGQGVGFSQGSGFGVENEAGESVQRVFLSRYEGGNGRCGVLNGDKPYGNRNDNEVDFGEIPWQAMVLLQTNKSLLCGGVITRPDVVVTSAACVEGLEAKNVLIKGGEWKLGIDEEPLPFQIVQVKHILRHPFYKKGSLLYDAAILVLTENLRWAKNIYPICLPKASDTLDAFYNGAGECIVTGWGKQVLQAHLLGSIMHSINVSLINPDECQSKLSQDYPHLLEQYDEDSCVCGQPTNPLNNICRVDIGSALACTTGDGQFVMRGVYSWDSGCQTGNQIGAFYKFDIEWYEWAIGLIESTRFTIKTSKVITTTKYTSQFNSGLTQGVKGGVKGSGIGSSQTSGSYSGGSGIATGSLTKFSSGSGLTGSSGFNSAIKGGKVSGSLTGSSLTGGSVSGSFGEAGATGAGGIKGFGAGGKGQFGFGQQGQYSSGQVSQFSSSGKYSSSSGGQSQSGFGSGLTYNTQLKAPITNSFSASYTEKKVFQTEPKIITYTTKPEIVTFTTKPEVYTYTTKPEVFTYTTKPEVFTYTTKPEIFTYTTKPKIVTYTTKPKIVTYTTKPQIITYETSGSGTNPQYVAPGVSFSGFSSLVGKNHPANCKCNEGKK